MGLALLMLAGLVASGRAELAPLVVAVGARGATRDWIALGEARRLAAAVPLLAQGVVVVAAVSLATSVSGAAAAIGLGHLVAIIASIALNPVARKGRAAGVGVDAWYLVAGIADQLLIAADTVLIVWVLSSADAGVYNTVYRLPLALLTLVGLCTAAAVPMATAAVTEGRLGLDTAHRRAALLGVAAGLGVLPAAAASWFLVEPLFGEAYVEGRHALLVLFLAAGFTAASAPFRVLYTAFGDDRTVAAMTSVVAVGNVVANLAAIQMWGIVGAAWTTAVSQLVMLVFLAGWSTRARRSSPATAALSV